MAVAKSSLMAGGQRGHQAWAEPVLASAPGLWAVGPPLLGLTHPPRKLRALLPRGSSGCPRWWGRGAPWQGLQSMQARQPPGQGLPSLSPAWACRFGAQPPCLLCWGDCGCFFCVLRGSRRLSRLRTNHVTQALEETPGDSRSLWLVFPALGVPRPEPPVGPARAEGQSHVLRVQGQRWKSTRRRPIPIVPSGMILVLGKEPHPDLCAPRLGLRGCAGAGPAPWNQGSTRNQGQPETIRG